MATFQPRDPHYEERVRGSFAKTGLLRTLAVTLEGLGPGWVEVALTPGPAVSQQHGFVHAGAVATLADAAAGFAALTLMPPGAGVLSTEFKINLLAPSVGERLVARGRVIKAGRTLTVAQSDVFAITAGEEKQVALFTATLMTVVGREGVQD